MARLGRYTLLQHLANRGIANLLLARADGIEGFERHVVVKRIDPALAHDPQLTKMFLDEARVAASLHHQNIIQVHDIGESDGEYFVAMEYVHGEDLRTILLQHARQRTQMPLPFVIAIAAAVAAGLEHAHEQRGGDKRPLRIVHRHITPSNIFIGYDGAIKIADFGVASDQIDAATLGYMAPEQLRNETIDRRSDIYSLGVVLYELATTSRLFRGDTDAAVVEQILRGRVPLPRVRRPELSNELSTIIMTALANDPDRRYQSADDLRASLDSYLERSGTPVQSAQIASYMRKLFGDKPEPWLDAAPADDDRRSNAPSQSRLISSSELLRASTAPPHSDPAISTDRHPKVHAGLELVDSPAFSTRTKAAIAILAALVVTASVVLVILLRTKDQPAAEPSHPAVAAIAPAPPAPAPAPVIEPIEAVEHVAPPDAPAAAKPAAAPPPRTVIRPAPAPKIDPTPPARLVAIAKPATTVDLPVAPPTPAPVDAAVAVPPPPVEPPAPRAPEIRTIAPATVERVAAMHSRELSQCEGGATLHGEIIVRFIVDPAGHVRKPQVQVRGIVNMPQLSACVLRSVMRWQFPQQGPDGAVGLYTLSFQ